SLLALGAAAVSGCGAVGAEGQGEVSELASSAARARPSPTRQPRTQTSPDKKQQRSGTPKVVLLGCHEYCRNAGGVGAPPVPPGQRIRIRNLGDKMKPLAGGILAFDFQCTRRQRCVGGFSVGTSFGGVRSDLRVPARGTRTLGIRLPDTARTKLRSL